MRSTLLVGTVASVVLGSGLLWVGSKLDGGPLSGFRSAEEPVLVFLVRSRRGVERVKAAVDPARIVAETPDAVALVEGRLVATSAPAVSEPFMAAGWADRPVEIFELPRSAGPAAGGPHHTAEGPTNDAQREKLVELMNKPTLSRGEALFVLRTLGGR